jgi:hypothetical protein
LQEQAFSKLKPLLFIAIIILSCSFGCDNDESGLLGKDDVELFAAITEQSDAFIVSGYFKSLNSSKKSDFGFDNIIAIDVTDAVNWKIIEVTINVDGQIQNGLLGDIAYLSSVENKDYYVPIIIPELNANHLESNFSVKFKKNVSYKIIVKSILGSLEQGVKSSGGLGCGNTRVSEDIYYEINQTIELI